jgi:hypothetical protein
LSQALAARTCCAVIVPADVNGFLTMSQKSALVQKALLRL